MTDTTQPPAETLAACPFCGADAELEHGSDHHGAWFNLGCSRHWGSGLVDADDGCIGGRIFYTETETPEAEAIIAWNTRAALTRRAGDDAIPAGEASEALRSLERFVGDHSGNDDTTDGMEVDRRAQEALSTLRGILAATKPPAGGDAGAVEREAERIGLAVADLVERHLTSPAMIWGLPKLPDSWMTELRSILVASLESELAALALPAPVVEGWQPIETAPYSTEVIVRAGEMTFRAELVCDGAMTTMEDACDQWAATREGEHPPCWSGGLCWEVNEDENTSLQPDAWMHVPAALSEGRSHG